MYQYEGKTFAEEDDLCAKCPAATSEDRLCPLMKALGSYSVAITQGSMVLDECDFYETLED